LLVIGPGAEQTRFAGGGSGGVEGYGHTQIGPELRRLLGSDRVVSNDWKTVDDQTLSAASVIVLCVDQENREGWDQLPQLPEEQEQLVRRCVRLNPRTVVVVNSGSGLMMDWNDSAAAVVWAYFPGQSGGTAIADVLTGAVNPSGKLPYTLEQKFADSPAAGYKPAGAGLRDRIDPKNKTQFERTLPQHPEIVYQEGVFAGYRWYDSRERTVRYPFGHGLSYTTFKYSDLQVDVGNAGVTVRATITNTGKRSGSETVQLYVRDPEAGVPRPLRELKGYVKIQLAPGESKPVEFTLSPVDLAFYDVTQKNWQVEPGEFILDLAASSRDIRLTEPIEWKTPLRYQRPTDNEPIQ
jgi:beta-glucosidase